MSKKGFAYGRTGSDKEIAMPALGEVSPIDKLTSQSQSDQQAVQSVQPQSFFNTVPDEVPEDVAQEMQEEQQDDQEVEELEEVEEIEEVEVVQPVKRNKEDNFAELRRAREAAERKAEKAERERDMFMQQLMDRQQPKVSKEEIVEDYEINLADDDLAAGKDVRKVDARTRALEKKLAQYEARAKEAAAESRVRAKCPDIDSVVNDENIYLLRQNYPEVAQSLSVAPDSWDKLASVYTMIKTLGIHKNKSYEVDKVKAVTNVKKPRPTVAVAPQQGESALAGVNAFITDYKQSAEGKKATWKEMQESMKRG